MHLVQRVLDNKRKYDPPVGTVASWIFSTGLDWNVKAASAARAVPGMGHAFLRKASLVRFATMNCSF
jgi:hypothetical protein